MTRCLISVYTLYLIIYVIMTQSLISVYTYLIIYVIMTQCLI